MFQAKKIELYMVILVHNSHETFGERTHLANALS